MTLRKNLSGEAQHRLILQVFGEIPDHRPRQKVVRIQIRDDLISGFVVFALKLPSLVQFDKRCEQYPAKLKSILGIEAAPSDTQIREIVDEVDPERIRPDFKRILFEVQRGKEFENFVFYKGHYLMAAYGTGHFSSDKVHCDDCLVKESKDGKITYQHHMLAAAIVHPKMKIVPTPCPGPIKKQDGQTKKLRLNAANETRINFLEYWETTEWTDKNGKAQQKQ